MFLAERPMNTEALSQKGAWDGLGTESWPWGQGQSEGGEMGRGKSVSALASSHDFCRTAPFPLGIWQRSLLETGTSRGSSASCMVWWLWVVASPSHCPAGPRHLAWAFLPVLPLIHPYLLAKAITFLKLFLIRGF